MPLGTNEVSYVTMQINRFISYIRILKIEHCPPINLISIIFRYYNLKQGNTMLILLNLPFRDYFKKYLLNQGL